MPFALEQVTQAAALAAGIPPQIINNGYLQTDGIDMLASKRAFFVFSQGATTGGGSINWYLQESADNSTWTANGSAGSFSNSGGNNTSATGLTTANKEYTMEVKDSQLTTGKRYVRLQLKETGSQNVYVAVVAFGAEGVHKPNNANNASAVTTQSVVS
jgi:hypothetical protein